MATSKHVCYKHTSAIQSRQCGAHSGSSQIFLIAHRDTAMKSKYVMDNCVCMNNQPNASLLCNSCLQHCRRMSCNS